MLGQIWGWSLIHGYEIDRPEIPKEAKVWTHHTLVRLLQAFKYLTHQITAIASRALMDSQR